MIETGIRQPQDWTNNFLIPLCQNVVGGMAVSCLSAIGTMLFTNASNATIQDVAIGSGALVACGFTAIRFFGDDVGILGAAFRAGQQSQQAEINRLQSQLYDANQQLDQLTSKPDIAIGGTRNNQQILDACADAEKLIRWAFDGQAVSRAACAKRGIKQRAWERANKVLVNAGIIANGRWMADSPQAALGQLQQHFDRRSKQSQQANMVTPY